VVTLVVAAGTIAASTGRLRQLSDPSISFSSILVVTVVALFAPVLVNLAPKVRMPAVALEIVLGVIVGPSGLGWLEIDLPVVVLSLLGLAFLLFLAGLEIDPARLRGRIGIISLGFVASLGLAVVVAFGLQPVETIRNPLFVAIMLASTSLGLVVPVIRDAGESDTEFGQTVLAASSLAEFGTILLVSLFFSTSSSGTPGLGSNVFLLVAFGVLVLVIGLGMTEAGRSLRVSSTLQALEDTSAQLGVRAAVLLLVLFVALASGLGIETILGAFVAGALLRFVDHEEHLVHAEFRRKVEAIGYGFLVPVFFVSSGARFDVDALVHSPGHLVLIPLFLLALLVVRGVPAFLYRRYFTTRRVMAAGLLQATSLTFVVVAARLGLELKVFDEASGAALVAAGLLSVIVFPPIALALLGDGDLAEDEELTDEPGGASPA
jgi:Kef-type K+ transport system membrane component KefB